MDVTGDDLAGVVDLFGALTRAELARALAELAFKLGEDHDPEVFEPVIDDALRSYHLVDVGSDALEGTRSTASDEPGEAETGGEGPEAGGDTVDDAYDDGDELSEDGGKGNEGVGQEYGAVIVPGPVAFPQLPAGATDLPHILDVEERSVDRDRASRAAEERFRRDAASAVASGDRERIVELHDVSYDLEIWAPVDLEAARGRLDGVLEG